MTNDEWFERLTLIAATVGYVIAIGLGVATILFR